MKTSFETLLERHKKEIYRFACRMTGDRDDAADILQDTFLKAFRSFPKLPPDTNHRAWLYRVAGRLALNLARSRKVRKTVPIEEALHLPARDGDLESLVETRRLARVLTVAVRNLSARQRIALLQRRFEGLPYSDIALTLGCSEESARAHVYQAMEKIRRNLTADRRNTDASKRAKKSRARRP